MIIIMIKNHISISCYSVVVSCVNGSIPECHQQTPSFDVIKNSFGDIAHRWFVSHFGEGYPCSSPRGARSFHLRFLYMHFGWQIFISSFCPIMHGAAFLWYLRVVSCLFSFVVIVFCHAIICQLTRWYPLFLLFWSQPWLCLPTPSLYPFRNSV